MLKTFFSTDKNFKKRPHLLTLIFKILMTAMPSIASSLPIICNFYVIPLLVNVMFPSELFQ